MIESFRKQLKEISFNLDEANENLSRERLEMQRLRQEILALKSNEKSLRDIDEANKKLLDDLQNEKCSSEFLKTEVSQKNLQIIALQSNVLEGENLIRALEDEVHKLKEELANMEDIEKKFLAVQDELAFISQERAKLFTANQSLGEELSET